MANYDALNSGPEETEDEKKQREDELRAIEEAYTRPSAERQPTLAEQLMGEEKEDEDAESEYKLFGGEEESSEPETMFDSPEAEDDSDEDGLEEEAEEDSVAAETPEDTEEATEDSQAEEESATTETPVAEEDPDVQQEAEAEADAEADAEDTPEPAVEEEPDDQEETPQETVEEDPETSAEEEPVTEETPAVEEDPDAQQEAEAEDAPDEEPEQESDLEEQSEPSTEKEPESEAEQEPEQEEEPGEEPEPIAEEEPITEAEEAPEPEPELESETVENPDTETSLNLNETAESEQESEVEAESEEEPLEEEPAPQAEEEERKSIEEAYAQEPIADEDRNVELPEDLNENQQDPEQEEIDSIEQAYDQEAIADQDRNVELPEELKTREEADPNQEDLPADSSSEQAKASENSANAVAGPVAALLLANYLSKRRDRNIQQNVNELAKDLKETQTRDEELKLANIEQSLRATKEDVRSGQAAEGRPDLNMNVPENAIKLSEIIAASPNSQTAAQENRPLTRMEYQRIASESNQQLPQYAEYLRSFGVTEHELIRQNEAKTVPGAERPFEQSREGYTPAGSSGSPVSGEGQQTQGAKPIENFSVPPHVANSELFSAPPRTFTETSARQEVYKKAVRYGVITGVVTMIFGTILFFIIR